MAMAWPTGLDPGVELTQRPQQPRETQLVMTANDPPPTARPAHTWRARHCRMSAHPPGGDVALLDAARHDITTGGAYRRALEHLDRHECHFPRRARIERQIYRIRALCELGEPLSSSRYKARLSANERSNARIRRALGACSP